MSKRRGNTRGKKPDKKRPAPKRFHVLVGTPTRETTIHYAHHVMCLQLQAYCTRANIDLSFEYCSEMGVHCARNQIVEKAKQMKADYLFFIDADTVVPTDCLARLMIHNAPVVSGLYTSRVRPFGPHMYYHADNKADRVPPNVFIEEGKWKNFVQVPYWTDLMDVDGVGTGCLLINMSVFDRLEKPYFDIKFTDDRQRFAQGEDLFFSRKLTAVGIPILVDTSIFPIRHITESVFINNLGQVETP